MKSNRLIFNPRKGWFFCFDMLTGRKDFRTGQWYPTVVRGQALPPVMSYRVGPYGTAAAAKEVMA